MSPGLYSLEPSRPCLWTKARENITRFIRARGRVKKSRGVWGKGPQEEMGWSLAVPCHYMATGEGQEGADGGSLKEWVVLGQRAWLRRHPRILSLERMRAGPGIPAWFCHSSHFLLKRHSERNTFKTGETNGDREGAIMCCWEETAWWYN